MFVLLCFVPPRANRLVQGFDSRPFVTSAAALPTCDPSTPENMCFGPFDEQVFEEREAHKDEYLLRPRKNGLFCLLIWTISLCRRSLFRTRSDRNIHLRTAAPTANILQFCGKYYPSADKLLLDYFFFLVLDAMLHGPGSQGWCRARLRAILGAALPHCFGMRLSPLTLLVMEMDRFAYTTLFLPLFRRHTP